MESFNNMIFSKMCDLESRHVQNGDFQKMEIFKNAMPIEIYIAMCRNVQKFIDIYIYSHVYVCKMMNFVYFPDSRFLRFFFVLCIFFVSCFLEFLNFRCSSISCYSFSETFTILLNQICLLILGFCSRPGAWECHHQILRDKLYRVHQLSSNLAPRELVV